MMNPTDIDECSDGSNFCEQLCNNTRGSYVCTCFDGYTLINDSISCQGEAILILHSAAIAVILLFNFNQI